MVDYRNGWAVALCACALAGPLAAEKPPALYLPFDRSLADRGSNRFAVAAQGDGIALATGGVFGGSVFIAGSGDWIDVAVDKHLSLQKGATLAFWFQRDDWENPYKGGSGWQTLANIDGMTLNVTAPGCPSHKPWTLEGTISRFAGELNGDTSRAIVRSEAGMISPRTWFHVALTYNPGLSNAILYVNGEQVDVASNAPLPRAEFVNPFRVGTWYKSNQAFRGWVDEVKIYDYPLGPAEVAREVNLGP